ncbi:MAG: methyltransferase [Candidatus Latescibacterota bacterium]
MSTAERIWEMARAFQPSRVLLTAVELGVFGILGGQAVESAAVAARMGTDRRGTDRLLNALAALGLLAKEGTRFRNAPDTLAALVPGQPGYIGGALGHVVNLWHTWSTLTDAVRAGTSVYRRDPQAAPEATRSFIAAMHTIATGQAQRVVAQLDLERVRRVLDVGGGSGAYAIELCRARPDLEAVVYDRPEVVPLMAQYVAEAGLSPRIRAVTGDFNRDELPSGFDLVFMSQILHSNSPAENGRLMAQARRALEPGGQVVVQEFVPDEGRTSPVPPVLFALNMLVATAAGDTYTESEIGAWLTAADFALPRRVDPPGTGTTLLLACLGT